MLPRVHRNVLSAAQRAQLPSADDVTGYHRKGWYVSPPIIPGPLLDRALAGVRRYYAGERDARLPETASYFDWTPFDGETMRTNGYLALQIEEIWSLVSLPIVAAIAARLAGARSIRLFHDRLIYKPHDLDPSQTVIGWHTDRRYWRTCTSTNMLTAWVPLAGYDLETGPLFAIDGSHRWPHNDDIRAFSKAPLEDLELEIESHGQSLRKTPLILGPGQVSFHNCLTIHGSPPNRGKRPRVALSIHLQDGANRYRRFINRKGRPSLHINDTLCRKTSAGLPDYADPEVFPTLWQEGPER